MIFLPHGPHINDASPVLPSLYSSCSRAELDYNDAYYHNQGANIWDKYHIFCVVRDTSMADVSERIQRMEIDLREATTRYDRCAAELQVSSTSMY